MFLPFPRKKWTNRRRCEGVVFKTWKQTKCRRERDMTLNRERQSDNQSRLFLVLSRPHLMFCVFAKSPQCLQSSLFETLRISFTLYLTNCFHSPLFWIQQMAVSLSNEYLVVLRVTCDSRAFFTVFTNCAKILADISFCWWMVSAFRGATLDLEVNKLV